MQKIIPIILNSIDKYSIIQYNNNKKVVKYVN